VIAEVLRVSWLSLARDRVALALTFVLPLAFFSVFAAVFGSMDEAGGGALDALVVVEDEGELGARFAAILEADPQLRLAAAPAADRGAARERVRRGEVVVAIVVPEGFTEAFQEAQDEDVELDLLADTSNPIGVQVARGLVQAAAVRLGVELVVEAEGGELAAQREPLAVRVDDVLGRGGKRPSIAFFAAGIGVMFLLFSLSGRSGILIEEREAGVLTRVLASRLGITRLLLGRWIFLAALGIAQVTLMFAWGALAFGLELFTPRHLAGFAVLTAVTSAAAAGFGLLLASACRTRAQLTGVSAVVVLIMSAVGGSMFPRFLMPERLQDLGLLTFNAWALDGYQAIFWYEASVSEILPQLGVLGALSVAFLAAARALAGRWSDA
jgi:ABC-2 type transport system permease protein